jgi:hypothetical protein
MTGMGFEQAAQSANETEGPTTFLERMPAVPEPGALKGCAANWLDIEGQQSEIKHIIDRSMFSDLFSLTLPSQTVQPITRQRQSALIKSACTH